MLTSSLIKNLSSDCKFLYNSNRILNLSNSIFEYFSNQNDNFIKLNKKDSEFNSYGWFINSQSDQLYKINLILNENEIEENYEDILRLFSNYGKS